MDKEINPTEIGELRSLENSLQQIQRIQLEQVQRAKNSLRTEYGLRECPNPLLSIPADLFQYGKCLVSISILLTEMIELFTGACLSSLCIHCSLGHINIC